jgi:hypothetical protein
VPLACLFGFTRLLEELLYTPKYSLIVQSLHSQLGAEETNETVQMTVATTEGDSVWGFRYSSAGKSRSLFYSTDVRTLRAQHPDPCSTRSPTSPGLSSPSLSAISPAP